MVLAKLLDTDGNNRQWQYARVLPVVAIVPVSPAGTFRRCRGTAAVLILSRVFFFGDGGSLVKNRHLKYVKIVESRLRYLVIGSVSVFSGKTARVSSRESEKLIYIYLVYKCVVSCYP